MDLNPREWTDIAAALIHRPPDWSAGGCLPTLDCITTITREGRWHERTKRRRIGSSSPNGGWTPEPRRVRWSPGLAALLSGTRAAFVLVGGRGTFCNQVQRGRREATE